MDPRPREMIARRGSRVGGKASVAAVRTDRYARRISRGFLAILASASPPATRSAFGTAGHSPLSRSGWQMPPPGAGAPTDRLRRSRFRVGGDARAALEVVSLAQVHRLRRSRFRVGGDARAAHEVVSLAQVLTRRHPAVALGGAGSGGGEGGDLLLERLEIGSRRVRRGGCLRRRRDGHR